jgi:hypothetical protein
MGWLKQVKKARGSRMNILEVLCLLVAAMYVAGLIGQALWDLTRLDRLEPKDEPEPGQKGTR